jgi:membrane fusion protein (multidrug efflux system)
MKKITIAVVVLVLVVVGFYLLKHRAAPDAGADESPVATVETAPLLRQDIVRTIDAFGVVAAGPSGGHVISAPYDCVIRSVYVAAGTSVAAGELLMKIAPSADAKLAFDSARSALALATKALAATQQRYDLKLATNQDLLAARQTEEDARLKAASYEARGLGGDGSIAAPSAGIVSRLELTAGALAPLGTPLVSIASRGDMEARLGVEPGSLLSIAPGQKVMLVSADRRNSGRIPAVVRSVGHGLDPATGAAEVRVALPPAAEFFLGEHVEASIEVEKRAGALVAPRSAVLPDGAAEVLYTVKDGKAVRHDVTLGIAAGDRVEVTGAGLNAGDPAVTLGNYELTDGMAVQVKGKPAKGAQKSTEAKQ